MAIAAQSADSLGTLSIDPILLHATIKGTQEGLMMCDLCPKAVGAACFFAPRHPLSIMVGLVGKTSGTVTLNMSEVGAMNLVSKLLDTEVTELDEGTIDGVMEIGNMVAGRIKEHLRDTEYEIDRISLPSVVFGPGYQVLYSRGVKTCGVEFELENVGFSLVNNRFFSTTVSFLPAAGR